MQESGRSMLVEGCIIHHYELDIYLAHSPPYIRQSNAVIVIHKKLSCMLSTDVMIALPRCCRATLPINHYGSLQTTL
jgi:hypothetical protein